MVENLGQKFVATMSGLMHRIFSSQHRSEVEIEDLRKTNEKLSDVSQRLRCLQEGQEDPLATLLDSMKKARRRERMDGERDGS